MNSLLTRRTIRKYSNKAVSEELLNRLLNEAARTQTMGNLQLYSVVVTRSQEKKQQLAPAHFNQPMVTEAPVVLTICADFNRTSQWARCRKAEPGYDNFLSFQNAAIDALLLLFRHHRLYAAADYRGATTATTHHACGHPHRWMACRRAGPVRPPALGELCASRNLSRLFSTRH